MATSPSALAEAPGEVNAWEVWDELGYVAHAAQAEILSSEARFRALCAGRRFGKSDVGGHELVPEALLTYGQRSTLLDLGKRREFWIVGPEYTDSEKEFRVVHNSMKRLGIPFDRPGTYYDAEGGNMSISAFEGTFQVHAKSAKHPETLVGEGLCGAILAEAAKLKERVWTKFIRPTLSDYHGWALFSSTPEGRNWFHDIYQNGKDPSKPEWASWRFAAWHNPYVYPLGIDDPEIALLRRDMSEETFNQEIAALFTEFAGRVFKDFDEDIHVTDLAFNPGWETYACADYGFTNPSVWLLIQVGPFGEVRVLAELYRTGLTSREFAAEIELRGLAPSGLRTFYPDPADPGATKELSDYLKIRAGGGTGGELKTRLDAIRKALRPRLPHLPDGHVDKVPTLLIDRSCLELQREMGEYRYPKSSAEAAASDRNVPEAPMKKDDHGPEALGRFFVGRFGRSGEGRRAKVSTARYSRRGAGA